MTAQQYAISEYPNVDEIYAKLNTLVSQPMRPVRREKMNEYLGYFETKCKRSKELTDEAKKYIPGGVQHNLAFNTRSRSPSKKRMGRSCGMPMGTSTLTFFKPADRRF